MKKFLLGTVALVAMAGSASAADLAARPYTKAPPMIAALYDWSGFYIGANGGYGTARKCWDIVTGAGAVLPEGCHDASGGTAGGQIGYRWQSGSMVYGIEGQGNWADFSGSNISAQAFVGGPQTNRSRVDAFGLFTGQIGYSWNNALLYVKGGGAVVGTKYDVFQTATGALLGSSRDTRVGASVGAGMEFGFTPNWSVGVEYNHIFLGTQNFAGAVVSERIRGDIDMVTAKINYRWGGPVVARY